jgi:DNA topoisomerase-1
LKNLIFIILSSQEKKALREEKLKQEKKFMCAVVDGKKEKVPF